MAYNPRFPHTLRVLRLQVVDGVPSVNPDGTPDYRPVAFALVTTVDGVPLRDAKGFITTEATEIPYGYRDANRNTTEYGDVTNKQRVLHCPMFLGEVQFGDVVEMTDYEGTKRMRAVKKVAFNFGSNLFVDELGN